MKLFICSPCFCSTEEQYKVQTKTIAVDFGQSDIYPKIEAGLAGLEIGVLGENLSFAFNG